MQPRCVAWLRGKDLQAAEGERETATFGGKLLADEDEDPPQTLLHGYGPPTTTRPSRFQTQRSSMAKQHGLNVTPPPSETTTIDGLTVPTLLDTGTNYTGHQWTVRLSAKESNGPLGKP